MNAKVLLILSVIVNVALAAALINLVRPSVPMFALALAASKGDDATRKAALAAVPTALRTGTHLLKFVAMAMLKPQSSHLEMMLRVRKNF